MGKCCRSGFRAWSCSGEHTARKGWTRSLPATQGFRFPFGVLCSEMPECARMLLHMDFGRVCPLTSGLALVSMLPHQPGSESSSRELLFGCVWDSRSLQWWDGEQRQPHAGSIQRVYSSWQQKKAPLVAPGMASEAVQHLKCRQIQCHTGQHLLWAFEPCDLFC